jgi:hypothetical protein
MAWIAFGVDLMVAVAAIIGIFVLVKDKSGFWRSIKAWFTSV